MLKVFNRLWMFGDSYSTPDYCVHPSASFWGLTAQHLGIHTILNLSRVSNSLDSVCQLVVGMQSEFVPGDLVLIGIPPLERITIFDGGKDTEYTGYIIDDVTWQSTAFDVPCHRGLISEQFFGNDEFLIAHSDRAWTEIQALRTVFFLTKWLDSADIDYLILNLSKPFLNNSMWLPSTAVANYVKQHTHCSIFNNTYYSVNLDINLPVDYSVGGWNGHHGPKGNRHYFETTIRPMLETLYA